MPELSRFDECLLAWFIDVVLSHQSCFEAVFSAAPLPAFPLAHADAECFFAELQRFELLQTADGPLFFWSAREPCIRNTLLLPAHRALSPRFCAAHAPLLVAIPCFYSYAGRPSRNDFEFLELTI